MRFSDWSSELCSSDLGIIGPSHCDRHVIPVNSRAGKKLYRACALRVGEAHRAIGFETLHLLRQRCSVLTRQIKEKPFEIAADLDIHAGRCSRRHLPLTVIALRKRSEEHTSELQSLMRISYAVFCLKKKTKTIKTQRITTNTNH